jgi:hypothetical protein
MLLFYYDIFFKGSLKVLTFGSFSVTFFYLILFKIW